MLPSLQRDADGGLTLYVQHDSLGKGKESNWLPAPNGPFFTALRLYWPKAEALEDRWTAPGATQLAQFQSSTADLRRLSASSHCFEICAK